MNFNLRRKQLAGKLAEEALDCLLVSALPNIEYLTGFTGSNGLLLFSGGDQVLLTDPRYEIQVARQTACKTRIARVSL
ncbi:MAG: aminopeptidase P family protein, partial [bacterium]|nr:aminopeptidase P family protein [bacterium]